MKFPILNISIQSLNSNFLEVLHIGDYWDYPDNKHIFDRYYLHHEYVDQQGQIFRLIGKSKSNIINRILHFKSEQLYFEDTHRSIDFDELKGLLLKRYDKLDEEMSRSVLMRLAQQAKSIKDLIG